jgi:hypothetical protein
MPKVFIPRNISGWWFNMSVQLWPFSISILQLMTLAVGMGLGLGIWNVLSKNGVGRYTAIIIAIPVFLAFVFIAFFKYSELTLFPFIAKMISTYFLDVTKKFQINWLRPDPHAINLARFRTTDHDVVIEQKELLLDEQELRKLESLTKVHKKSRKE